MGLSHRAQEHRRDGEGWNTGPRCVRWGFPKRAAEKLLRVNPSEEAWWERRPESRAGVPRCRARSKG